MTEGVTFSANQICGCIAVVSSVHYFCHAADVLMLCISKSGPLSKCLVLAEMKLEIYHIALLFPDRYSNVDSVVFTEIPLK